MNSQYFYRFNELVQSWECVGKCGSNPSFEWGLMMASNPYQKLVFGEEAPTAGMKFG